MKTKVFLCHFCVYLQMVFPKDKAYRSRKEASSSREWAWSILNSRFGESSQWLFTFRYLFDVVLQHSNIARNVCWNMHECVCSKFSVWKPKNHFITMKIIESKVRIRTYFNRKRNFQSHFMCSFQSVTEIRSNIIVSDNWMRVDSLSHVAQHSGN